MYRKIVGNSLVASVSFVMCDVYAQTSESTQEQASSLNPVVVTATRQKSHLLDIPGTVTFISKDQMDERQVNSTEDLVKYEPGLTIKRNTSGTDPFGNLGSYQIRGVGANRVQVRVDGARVQEQIQDGNRNFVDLSTLKSVEVVHGPGSVLWGADALGGTVMYQTLDPEDLLKRTHTAFAGQVGAGFDSLDNSVPKSAALAFQISPTLQGLVMYNHTTSHQAKLKKARADGGIWGCPRGVDAIRCNKLNPMNMTTQSMLSKLVWTPNDDHLFKLTGEIYNSKADVSQMYDYGRQPDGSFNGDYNRQQKQKRYRIGLEHVWEIRRPWLEQLRWQLQYSPQKREVISHRYQRNAAGIGTSTADWLSYKEDFLQFDLQLTSLAHFWGAHHRFSYGFQGDTTKTDYEKVTDKYNHSTGISTTTRGGGFNFANSRTTRADLYLQDEISWFDDRFILTPGVRWANYSIDPNTNSDYVASPGAEPKKQTKGKLVPQVGALFKLTENYSIYAKYAEGFKMPTAQQLYTSLPSVGMNLIPNPNLKPESVRSYETGLRGFFKDSAYFDQATFSIGVFKADYKDFIQNFYNIPGTDDYTYRNLSKVNIWGIEASGEIRFNENWTISNSLAWQRGNSRYDEGSAKQPHDGVVPLTDVFGVTWTQPEWGTNVEVFGTFVQGVKRTSEPDMFKPSGYAVYDTYLTWTPPALRDHNGRSVTFRIGVENITDKRYFVAPLSGYDRVPSSSVAISNPLELQTAAGRTFKLSTSVRF